jgi:membrane protease YdiL (CAAX protease family)
LNKLDRKTCFQEGNIERKKWNSAIDSLAKRLGLSVFLILILYIFTEAISSVISIFVFGESQIAILLIKFILFSVLSFVVIPWLLRFLSGMPSFKIYLEQIGLKLPFTFSKLLLVTISSYMIFIAFQSLGAALYHHSIRQKLVFDFSRHSLFEPGSIIAAVFEELILRGVIVAILISHFSDKRAIVTSALIFSCLHSLNMLDPETSKVWILCQVVWAFGFGIIYAYILTRLKSLFPLIILHYLLNSLAGVWFVGLGSHGLTSGL